MVVTLRLRDLRADEAALDQTTVWMGDCSTHKAAPDCYIVGCLFFFQAEDGIRDYKVTGVQTCALPISRVRSASVAFAVPISMPRYTCMESTEIISAPICSASSSAMADFPTAVGPAIRKIGRAWCRGRR